MYDAVVVGGGIVGSSVGYHLAREGVETLLVDRRDAGRATSAGAGIVSPGTSSRTADDDWFAFATDAGDYYPGLVDRLESDGVSDTSYGRVGLIAAAVDDDEIVPYEEATARIEARRDELPEIEAIDPATATDRVPELAEPQRAFHVPDAARVNGRTFARALREAGRNHGLETAERDVTRIRTRDRPGGRDPQVTGVETADGSGIDADRVVIAGGAWSSAFGGDLGIGIPVEPKRGQIVHLDLPDAETGSWPILEGFRHHYIVPWPDGRLVAGATREAGSGFDPRVTAGGLREVLEEALRVAPGLDDATVIEHRVGLRPVCADGVPVLGPVPGVEGAHLATGHGATGLTLGPYSGRVVADRILDGKSIPDAVSASRFADGSG
ncbi:NAD(P)/FAD-dependent oxidoreductase [Halorubrum halodurans]|uniref:FAD-dependent oxidoreductase n=1 Tax=Halorubrum halodurans TaxID=1383851 RepID=A0A256IBS2_9EURY|nr:FAD-dependent oxidoreductase [Halorubrum halodurans]OYR54005.1 FAD-dependent oxidoreductase [Halorubrum halodurans]